MHACMHAHGGLYSVALSTLIAEPQCTRPSLPVKPHNSGSASTTVSLRLTRQMCLSVRRQLKTKRYSDIPRRKKKETLFSLPSHILSAVGGGWSSFSSSCSCSCSCFPPISNSPSASDHHNGFAGG
ncbi:hypothetical protein K461DRAFT_51502 [Myriangium duriaei CBS 260.36]|uniref:Uncharacterized protein n=1 Tax=Myriangium duriaei CBS 260.36 TaxID=1168546 RepID=A0A9P4IS39_9PEZI|nr:hypothetical protein K461DRAFT_51502 [Myriangium duriaei CBS 260.36]